MTSLREEVGRLAPWYYAFELGDVRTDDFEPCDRHGHRRVSLPAELEPLIRDRVILDVGCNEGGYTFAALDRGERRAQGFDCRPINVEKARLVSRLQGRKNALFHVATADDGWSGARPPVDLVFLCGLVYHLPDPWRTIEQYCRIAREGMFLTSMLYGGEDGYTPNGEDSTIAAAVRPDVVAMVPNTLETLVSELACHDFHPLYLVENVASGFAGGCGCWFVNCARFPAVRFLQARRTDPVAVHLVPARVDADDAERLWAFDVVLWNRTQQPLDMHGTLAVTSGDGRRLETLGPEALRLGPRTPAVSCQSSTRVRLQVRPQREPVTLSAEVRSRDGKPLGRNAVEVRPEE